MKGVRISARTAITLAVVLASFAGGIIDYRVTVSRVPPIPALCRVSTDECEAVRSRELTRRRERIDALEGDHRRRSWLFALPVLGAALGLTAMSLRRRGVLREQQRIFANVGVGGVALGLVVSGLLWLADSTAIEPAALPAYFPSFILLAVAAAGGTIVRFRSGERLERAEGASEQPWQRSLRRIPLAGVGLTAVTFLLAWIFSGQQPSCGGGESYAAPGWTDYVLWSALATSVGAGVLGLLGLVVRRWFVALVCFAVNPVLLIFMIASTCAFY